MDIERLRRLPDEELMRLQDEAMLHRAAHSNMFLVELVRREEIRQEERIEELTRSVNRLAWIVTGATILWASVTLGVLIIEM